jgi:fatty-acid desaturase
MSTAPSLWRSLPYSQFRRQPTFYLRYDAVHIAIALFLCALLFAVGWPGLFPSLSPWTLLALPLATYLVIQAHVFIHCASHGAWPRAINRLVGELCGIVVLTKFASWEIVHRRHHRYSDDPERDPHPAIRSYWGYAGQTLLNVERQLQQEYLDVYGDTPANRRYEALRSVVSFGSGVGIALFWWMLLGTGGMLYLFLPASVLAGLFVIHFNWVGHNAHTKDGTIEPVNLDHGWYWWGNRLFFGIYYHGNHHRMAMLFNPMKLRERRADRGETEEA